MATRLVIGAGTIGLLLRARGRVLLPSWTGSASGCRSSRKLGAARAVTDASALDGACLEVAVDATGGAGGDRDRVGLLGHGGRMVVFGVSPAPGRDQRLAIPGYNDKSLSPGRWLSCAASARPDGGYRTAAASPACWPRSGTSRSDQHFIACSSHFPGRQLRSVADLGIPPATEAISMPDRSPGIQAQVRRDCAGAGWRSRSRPGL